MSCSDLCIVYTALLTTREEFRDLLSEYPDVISSKGFLAADPKHPVRRLDAEKLESTKKRSLQLWNLQESSDVLPLLGPFTHGEDTRWFLEALWRLPPSQYSNRF